MEVIKRLRKAVRGLTFSLSDNDIIGKKFRYVIDKKGHVRIIYDEHGPHTVSRKKTGDSYKALFDLRSAEIRELMQKTDYMEVVQDGLEIIVCCYKEKAGRQIHLVANNIVSIDEVLGTKVGEMRFASGELSSVSVSDYCESARATLGAIRGEDEKKRFQRVYDIVSLFSGAGLLDKSFDEPRFRFVFACDFDKDACETYRANIGDIECRDIRTVEGNEVPSCDIVLGGSCCQAFSVANQHNRDSQEGEDKRQLVYEFCRIVSEKNPSVWVLENVPQILTRAGGRYLDGIMSRLSGYEITARVVTDCEVGGYSTRKRAIIIGSRIGRIMLPDRPVMMHTVREALSKVDSSWFNYGDITTSGENVTEAMQYVPEGGNWENVPRKLWGSHGWRKGKTQSNVLRRLAFDKPAPSLANFRKCLMMPPTANRVLSVAEAASIMGLDKTFRFLGSLSSRQQQCSNGVTRAMGQIIKQAVLAKLDSTLAVPALV